MVNIINLEAEARRAFRRVMLKDETGICSTALSDYIANKNLSFFEVKEKNTGHTYYAISVDAGMVGKTSVSLYDKYDLSSGRVVLSTQILPFDVKESEIIVVPSDDTIHKIVQNKGIPFISTMTSSFLQSNYDVVEKYDVVLPRKKSLARLSLAEKIADYNVNMGDGEVLTFAQYDEIYSPEKGRAGCLNGSSLPDCICFSHKVVLEKGDERYEIQKGGYLLDMVANKYIVAAPNAVTFYPMESLLPKAVLGRLSDNAKTYEGRFC